jgi:hypothetical protein
MDYLATKEIIHSTSILSETDTEFINDSIGEIQDNWGKKQIFRTETEMRISVLNEIKFPTAAAKYWQCVREQSVFYEQLVIASFEFRRNGVKQEKILRKLEKEKAKAAPDDLKMRSLVIDLEEAKFGQLSLAQTAKDRVRELRLWSQLMQECVNADPNFNTEDVNEHQLVSYAHRFERQRAEMGTSGSPSEQANLVGQMQSAHKRLGELGVKREEVPAITMRKKPIAQLVEDGKIALHWEQ